MEGGTGQGKGRSGFYPDLWLPVLLPFNKLNQSAKTKGHLLWTTGSITTGKKRDQHQILRGDSLEATAVAWQSDK